MQKMTIGSWIQVAMAVTIIALILFIFLRKPTDIKQEVTKYEIDLIKKEIANLDERYRQDSIRNAKQEADIINRYDNVITRINKNVNSLYKQLNEEIDTVHNLNGNDSFILFSTWVPKED